MCGKTVENIHTMYFKTKHNLLNRYKKNNYKSTCAY